MHTNAIVKLGSLLETTWFWAALGFWLGLLGYVLLIKGA